MVQTMCAQIDLCTPVFHSCTRDISTMHGAFQMPTMPDNSFSNWFGEIGAMLVSSSELDYVEGRC